MMTSFPNWRLFSWQLGEDTGKTFLWLKWTVSAAASPEIWGIQDFGWDCFILPATSQARSGQDSAALSSVVFMVRRPLLSLIKRLKELFVGEPLPELPLLHGHGSCQQKRQQVEEESPRRCWLWTWWTWWTLVWNQLQISTGGWCCSSLLCRRFLYQRSH